MHLVRGSAEVYSLWKNQGGRGRLLINLSRYLQFIELDEHEGFRTPSSLPLKTENLVSGYEARVDHRSLLWVATQANIGRELVHLLPPSDFREKESALAQASEPWLAAHQGYRLLHLGTLRTLTAQLPESEEPVLLNIDASFLASVEPQALAQQLSHSSLRTDLITLNLSEDNPAVTEPERQRLRSLAQLLAR